MQATNTTKEVAFLGFASSNLRALDVFFSNHTDNRYCISVPEKSDIHVLDVDGLPATTNLQSHAKQHPHAKIICVSRDPIERAQCRLGKPFNLKELIAAMDRISRKMLENLEELDGECVQKGRTKELTSAAQSRGFDASSPNKTRHLHGVAEQRADANFWGVRWNAKEIGTMLETYHWAHFLQGHVSRVSRKAKNLNQPVKLQTKFQTIVCLPQAGVSMVDCPSPRLRLACLQMMRRQNPPERRDYEISLPPESEIHWLSNGEFSAYKTDALLWDLALWTSRGRLPDDLDADKPYKLNSWPNFTRLQTEDYMLCITAMMCRKAYSVNELSQKLKLPAGYVCQFFSGVHALGLMNAHVQDSVSVFSWEQPEKRKLGLIARLFRRLAG